MWCVDIRAGQLGDSVSSDYTVVKIVRCIWYRIGAVYCCLSSLPPKRNWWASVLLRGTIVNRTCGIHKNLYI